MKALRKPSVGASGLVAKPGRVLEDNFVGSLPCWLQVFNLRHLASVLTAGPHAPRARNAKDYRLSQQTLVG